MKTIGGDGQKEMYDKADTRAKELDADKCGCELPRAPE